MLDNVADSGYGRTMKHSKRTHTEQRHLTASGYVASYTRKLALARARLGRCRNGEGSLKAWSLAHEDVRHYRKGLIFWTRELDSIECPA